MIPMPRHIWFCVLIYLALLAPGACASPALLGSAVADAYFAFAPLYSLYRAYAGYLFHGFAVAIPPGLETACQSCSARLEAVQVAFITQTELQHVEEIGHLVRLRQNLASFCDRYQESIAAISVTDPIDPSLLDQAASESLFASVFELNKRFERLLDLAIENLEQAHDRWAFNAAFATRTLMNQETIERIDSALAQIILGSEETPSPPESLPEEIAQALQSLAALSSRDLSLPEQGEAEALARLIHTFLVKDDQGLAGG